MTTTYIPAIKVSYLALMKRELGKIKTVETIHDKPVVLPKEPKLRLKESILQSNILVRRTKPLPIFKIEEIKNIEYKIRKLQDEFRYLSITRLMDSYFYDQELKRCYERVSHHRLLIHLSKNQIIEGIHLRAQEEFPDDPHYVRIQTRNLEEIFNYQLEDQVYEQNELWHSIYLLEMIS